MKKATVADLRNHFRKVSAWIENGEAVEITRRGRTFARLVPVEAPTKVPKVDFAAQRKEIWGTRFLSEKEIAEMRAAELGDRS